MFYTIGKELCSAKLIHNLMYLISMSKRRRNIELNKRTPFQDKSKTILSQFSAAKMVNRLLMHGRVL